MRGLWKWEGDGLESLQKQDERNCSARRASGEGTLTALPRDDEEWCASFVAPKHPASADGRLQLSRNPLKKMWSLREQLFHRWPEDVTGDSTMHTAILLAAGFCHLWRKNSTSAPYLTPLPPCSWPVGSLPFVLWILVLPSISPSWRPGHLEVTLSPSWRQCQCCDWVIRALPCSLSIVCSYRLPRPTAMCHPHPQSPCLLSFSQRMSGHPHSLSQSLTSLLNWPTF